MAKSGRQYADEVRALRDAGVEFPRAASGYILADAANWSTGQKAAVTRAVNRLDIDTEAAEPLDEDRAEEIFDEGFGEPDADDEFDDIDFFDPEFAEELVDEENDQYEEDT